MQKYLKKKKIKLIKVEITIRNDYDNNKNQFVEIINFLKKFKEVKICLDPDATRKSLDLQKYLSYIVKCSIMRIEDDLKYYNAEEIRKLVLSNS